MSTKVEKPVPVRMKTVTQDGISQDFRIKIGTQAAPLSRSGR
jgi:hypothetical protein